MGRIFFARDRGDIDLFEAGLFEPAMEVGFAEPKPAVAVEFVRFFELVFEEVEDHYLARRAEDFVRGGESFIRLVGVMERLAENDEVDGVGIDGWVFQIAKTEFEIFEAVPFCLFDAEGHHFFGVIDGDDFFGATGEQFGKEAFAGTEVSDC